MIGFSLGLSSDGCVAVGATVADAGVIGRHTGCVKRGVIEAASATVA
jgi:hypothetical protein